MNNEDLGEWREVMNCVVVPFGIIYVAADARRFEPGKFEDRVNDPWVTPTLASINAFFTKRTGEEVFFEEKDPVPSIVSYQMNKQDIYSHCFVSNIVQT